MMLRPLQRNRIVLLGLGHTNAHILKQWRMQPIQGASLICVADYPVATYSGMMPGVLSGQYQAEDMEIDLVRLCAVSGVRLLVERVTSIDFQKRELLFDSRAPLRFDFLSVGIGSRPSQQGVAIAENARLLSIKPMQTFLQRLESAIQSASQRSQGDQPLRMHIVGGGVASIEIACCLRKRYQDKIQAKQLSLNLVVGDELGGGLLPKTRTLIQHELQHAGITIIQGKRVTSVTETSLQLDDQSQEPTDLVIWATQAVGSDFLRELSLPHDERGFLLTKPTLQSTGDDRVFAVGDSGTCPEHALPKAGVYAVRQGPVLWDNLTRAVAGKPLVPFHPQKRFLKLLNLGDGRAAVEHLGVSKVGRWAWRLKDYIDRKFMRMYQDYQFRPMAPSAEDAATVEAMRCTGCGGKLGGTSLHAALSRMEVEPSDAVLLGLDQSDDAAIIRTQNNQTTVTTDFFAAPLDDPFIAGRIAALNSSSDCFAMNAQPRAALTLVEIPFGHPREQSETLYEVLAGAQHEFRQMGTVIAGGHSIEGPRLTAGFTMLSDQLGEPTQKGNLRVGDQLILTKPLGSGILLAGHMRGDCRGEWFQELLANMLISNQVALSLVEKFSIEAMTDVTGFGLAVHLLEMLQASGLGASLAIQDIPVLSGCIELLEQGVESTLAPDNRASISSLQMDLSDSAEKRKSEVVFDPQTCGGLLVAVNEKQTAPVLAFLADQGFGSAQVIGNVIDPNQLETGMNLQLR